VKALEGRGLCAPRPRNITSRGGAIHGPSGGVFGAEDALEAGAGELDADQSLALCRGFDYMDHAPRCGEVGFGAARGVVRKRNPDFELGADGDVETRDEGGAAAA